MYLYHVAYGLPGCQDIVHAVMSLRAPVANIRSVVLGRKSACFKYTVFSLLHNPRQMHASRMAVAKGVLQQDLRFPDILLFPSAAQLQRVKLCPELPLGSAFLFYIHMPVTSYDSFHTPLNFPPRSTLHPQDIPY